MRNFTTLLSTVRRAYAVNNRHISTTWCLQHCHDGGGSAFIKGSGGSALITSLWPPCRPFIWGLNSLQFIHNNARVMEIKIISEEQIKPSSPTPHHLKTFKLSILDQIFFPIYTPCVFYFLNTTNNTNLNQSKNLKTSLSHTLTRFYPLAGRVKDNFEIDCNDQGVCFTEARVNGNLFDFLSQPNDHLIQRFFPLHPSVAKSTLGNYVASVQVNIFDCGGIALGTRVSHQLIDGSLYFTFLKSWAAITRGSSQVTNLSFIATTLFPQNLSLKYSLPTKLVSDGNNTITRRFVLGEIALNFLKSKVPDPHPKPTRVEAASSLIWKCAAKAATNVRTFNQHSPHLLLSFVDIRRRDLPKLPDESLGNLIVGAIAVCFPNLDLELPTLMGEVKKSIASVNYDLISKFKGERGYLELDGMLKMFNDLFENVDEGDCVVLTSLCKSGLYEIDFGWGKPVWFCYDNPGASRIVALADTFKGDGIEATVSLSPQEMDIFERDEELLSYVSMDYSPLELFVDSHH